MNIENIKIEERFSQVCVWPSTIVGKEKIKDFEEFMMKEFKTRVQYLEEIKTFPDKVNGKSDPETGGRNDVFFAVHDEDVGKFAIPRLAVGIRWIEDVLSKVNYNQKIYPKRVFDYMTWDPCPKKGKSK